MKKSLIYLSLFCMVLMLFSCKGKGGVKSSFMATSSGRPYEIIVVIDLGMWERPAGRALYNVLDTDVPGLPQPERSFRIMYSAPQTFDTTLKLIRNIIIVDIQNIYTQPKIKYAYDVYANPQMVVTIQAPNEQEFETFVEQNGQKIIDLFTSAEMNRQVDNLKAGHSDYISTKVNSMFGSDIWLPAELTSLKEGENFLWASTNRATADENFIIYTFPYRDKDTFTEEYFIHKRDSVLRQNIPGAFEGSFMATDPITVSTRAIQVAGDYTFEARGLWKMTGKDKMGGPFVSHSRLDKANNRIVVAEVFIYSPDKLKRNIMRMMEASLYTLRLPYELDQNKLPEVRIVPDAPESN